MRDKQIALGAAYVTLDNAFKSYRNKIKEKLGEDAEKELYKNDKEVQVAEKIIDPDTGEIKEVIKNMKKSGVGGPWELFFDATSNLWSKNGRTNYETLMEVQKQANITLKAKGWLLLYEVFEMLDYPLGCIDKNMLAASTNVGWIYDPYDPSRSSWVSFGISDELGNANEVGRELFNCEERDALLSFNCDGVITVDLGNSKSFAWYVK